MSKITVCFVFVLMVAALETLNAQNYYDAGDVDFVDYGPAPPPRAPPANSRSKFEIKIELFSLNFFTLLGARRILKGARWFPRQTFQPAPPSYSVSQHQYNSYNWY